MELDGYKIVEVKPVEMASRGKAIVTTSRDTPGAVKSVLEYPTGTYDVAVNCYDHLGCSSKYDIYINDKVIGVWKGDLEDKLQHDFSELLDGHSATRITFPGVKVEKGDLLKIVETPDGNEFAPLDYVSILPEGVIDLLFLASESTTSTGKHHHPRYTLVIFRNSA
jgi:alpha-glucuronidase